MPLAYLVFFSETVAAVCLIAGLFTRFVAAAIAIELAVITFAVYWPHGFHFAQTPGGGAELPMLWGFMVFLGSRCAVADPIRSTARSAGRSGREGFMIGHVISRRALLAGAAASGILSRAACRRAVLSRPPDPADRAVSAGRTGRCHRAHRRPAARRRSSASPSSSRTAAAPRARSAPRLVAAAEPDGYTLLCGNISSLVVTPVVTNNRDYDPAKAFTPVAKLSQNFEVLVVHPDFPAKIGAASCRLRQGQSRQAQLRLRRPRQRQPSRRRAVQAQDRHRHRPRALQGRGRSRNRA